MIKCKKGELENFEKLKICRYNNPSFENEIELNKKGRKIIEINKNNKISTFVSIFDDDVINNEDFIDSEDFNDYKEHIKKKKKKKKKEDNLYSFNSYCFFNSIYINCCLVL